MTDELAGKAASPPSKAGWRIARMMARAGLASRREAEAWIAAGRVAVNGVVVVSPAIRIGADDAVTVDGKPVPQRERTRLFLFHKPRGLVTTKTDPEGRPTIFDALPEHLPRVVTIGRLDVNTEGLLLLTNDGGLARVLEHPQTGWLRRYRVRAHGKVTQAQLEALRNGITIDGIHYGPIEATLDRVQGSNVWLTFAIREGKNREVRNVLGAFDLAVNRLIRLSFGPFQLGELAEGAVEEVRTRVLRDQLGKKIAALADADFDAPLSARNDPSLERRTPARRLAAGAQRASKDDAKKHRRSPAREERERHGKPHPWRGRNREMPIGDEPASQDPPRKTKAGLLTDRKGRRVLVQRGQPAQRPEPERRERRRPARDRQHGPRPATPERDRRK